ncbi:MAG: RNA polymerase factor sigma-54 [Bacteroidetes bacterium]|jgi:RNA polymerase sigma-54 factor|nr:RNA polymerase factor sigma-54 [Bacteroidota bacterium]
MLKQGMNQKLLQKLSPQQIQFIQLLQLNLTELEARLEEELAENPALEAEPEDPPGDEFDAPAETPADEADKEDETRDWDEDMDINQYLTDDDGNDSYYNSYDPDNERDDIPYAGAQTLFSLLEAQLNVSASFNERDTAIARHLIGMIEDDGYIRRPLKSIAYDLMFLSGITTDETELEAILKRIQVFDPPGIAARSLEECLLIQLRRMPPHPYKELAIKIISKYITQLGNKHYDKLMRSLKVEADELRSAIDLITRLNPKPGESQAEAKTQYVNPDFVVTEMEGDLVVSLNSKNAPELKISRSYRETLAGFQAAKKVTNEQKAQVQFIKQKLDSAKWFIDAIKQRQNTLMQVMQTIVKLQAPFFRTGDMSKLQPMILKDVADRIHMDISTISRVASSKYVQTDHGIYSLKEFFSEGITTDDGSEVSNIEVKEKLKEFVLQEDKDKPLTDDELTDMMKDLGYNIARRTIAKYREQLNIPVARLRKVL